MLNNISFQDHYTWCQAYLQFVVLQGKFLRPIMGPLPVPGFLQNIVFRQITKKVDAQAKAQGRDSVLLQDFQTSDGSPSSERVQ